MPVPPHGVHLVHYFHKVHFMNQSQLQHIFLVSHMPFPVLGLQDETTLILAVIHTCMNPQMKAENDIFIIICERATWR
jgi:hypothetical protein